MKNFIASLRWRGMIHDMVPGTAEHLSSGMATGYVGFDPSAPSLHLGNLVAIMLLKHFQEAGHQPIALVGGATGMIGDPSGRSQERLFLTEEVLRYNESCIAKQLEKFLDFSTGQNKALLLNNFDWFKDISFLSLLREVGKHIPIGYMMAKDSVKQRIETGISYTEFSYQLLQAYDFYYLYLHKNVTLQMGGSDQWGNLTTGVELIRKKAQCQAFAVTAPLLTRADGTKFGKTASGSNIWLDPAKTSPYELYQFLLNGGDHEVEKLIKIFSFCTQEEVEAFILAHQAKPEMRLLQQTLAKIVTTMVHSEAACRQAMVCSNILFGHTDSVEALYALSEEDLLNVCITIPKVPIARTALEAVDTMVSLLSVATENRIIPSKSEARRVIASSGMKVNKVLITDPYKKPDVALLHNRYLLVQKGKKNYYLIVVE
ncbi:MAG: tyrosine--tRNA ligase [Candidatus Cardinium sp.]|uniref:tyrosine--tRNA ligase n=1 Tax=Cardinium endosymbiont of Dermatophagoides farinae TaxID=2597823 RepID=UPI001183A4FF|nr:tyrosine--tRNA ligase [Cardinium endosymbiont of Dermatophagoides farinae]TSJ80774.1 tyrosine--tRNA ligase [Cardinium endosymbiont of Dermatophagoides farinae]UWW96778.1 MAG: tyrosine--tRNA ligase [Candidatus Cardinium sp.]